MRRAAFILAGLVALAGQAAAQEDIFMPGVIGAEQGMSGIDFDSARMSFFNQADANGDLALSPDEMGQAMAHGGSSLFDGSDVDGQRWRRPRQRGRGNLGGAGLWRGQLAGGS